MEDKREDTDRQEEGVGRIGRSSHAKRVAGNHEEGSLLRLDQAHYQGSTQGALQIEKGRKLVGVVPASCNRRSPSSVQGEQHNRDSLGILLVEWPASCNRVKAVAQQDSRSYGENLEEDTGLCTPLGNEGP